MERSSDFSVERILSPHFGPCRTEEPPVGPRYTLSPAPQYAPAPVSVPVHSYPTMRFGAYLYPYGGRIYPNSTIYFSSSAGVNAQSEQPEGFSGAPQHQQAREKSAESTEGKRRRTMFTESQTKLLEEMLALSRYPTAGARMKLARKIGLSEETVRVWFKNRRARRKQQQQQQQQQYSGSNIKMANPELTSGTAGDGKLLVIL